MVARNWEEGVGMENGWLFNESEVIFGGNDKNVLELNAGHGCATLRMHLLPLNYTL